MSQYAAIPRAPAAIAPQTSASSDTAAMPTMRPDPARNGISNGAQQAAQAMASPAIGSFDFMWHFLVWLRFAAFYKFK